MASSKKKQISRNLPLYMRDRNKSKDMGDDLPMSMEGSPTVTDTETGETTYGSPRRRPKHKKKGGMIECRGGGIAISGKKFQGVF